MSKQAAANQTTPRLVAALKDADLAPMPPTDQAQWLHPSQVPQGFEDLFEAGPFKLLVLGEHYPPLGLIRRFEDILRALHDRSGLWSREVPYEHIAYDKRHKTLFASWARHGSKHRRLRGALARINRGSSPEARAFTRRLTAELLQRLLTEKPPWDLSRVIYAVSMRVMLEYTLAAPPLFPDARRLRELVREHSAVPGGYFGLVRQPEAEAILGQVLGRRDELPMGSLARHLVDLHLATPAEFTEDDLQGQLWLPVVTHENQATAAANLLGLLWEYGEYEYARGILDEDRAMSVLVEEGLRLGQVFPANMLTATRPFTLDGQTLPPGSPARLCFAAANRDPKVFDDPDVFNPRLERRVPNITFGEGEYRCQGERGARQFIMDVLTTMLNGLPARSRLQDGCLLREPGIDMAIACLPVVPA